MRFARLARALRGVRVIRLLRYISSLRTIVPLGGQADLLNQLCTIHTVDDGSFRNPAEICTSGGNGSWNLPLLQTTGGFSTIQTVVVWDFWNHQQYFDHLEYIWGFQLFETSTILMLITTL